MTDAELFTTTRERLSTAVIGDMLDAAGFTHQFLPPGIRALDGLYRDARAIEVLSSPVFSAGCYAQDQRLRGHPIEFAGGARVEPGDVVGDVEGVVIDPRARAGAIVADAAAKVAAEERVRNRIGAGQSTQPILDETGVI